VQAKTEDNTVKEVNDVVSCNADCIWWTVSKTAWCLGRLGVRDPQTFLVYGPDRACKSSEKFALHQNDNQPAKYRLTVKTMGVPPRLFPIVWSESIMT